MTFFYNLNKKLKDVLETPKSVHQNLNEGRDAVAEKIEPPIKTDPSERGKYKGQSVADLKKAKAANLKITAGYRERGEKVPQAAKEKTAELNFAIRAKQAHGGKWGKIKEGVGGSLRDTMIAMIKDMRDEAYHENVSITDDLADEFNDLHDRVKASGDPLLMKAFGRMQSLADMEPWEQAEGATKVLKMLVPSEMDEDMSADKAMAQQTLDAMSKSNDQDLIRDLQKKAGVPTTGKIQSPQPGQQSMAEDDMEEGNAFSKAVVDAKKDGIQPGETIKVGGKTYPVKESKKAKPDYLDLDHDGNKKESMKKAAADAKELKKGQTNKIDEEYSVGMSDQRAAKLILDKIKGLPMRNIQDIERNVARYLGMVGKAPTDVKHLSALIYTDLENMGLLEGWDDMLKDVDRRAGEMKKGEKTRGHKGEIEKTATGIRHTRSYNPKTGETDTGDEEEKPQGEKRRGRPKGKGKSMGAKGPSGKSKLMTREEIEEAIAALEGHGYSVAKLDEKAVSVSQQQAAGIALKAKRAGKTPPGSGAAAEMSKMSEKELEKFAGTKHKCLPKKKKEMDETTVSGSVATSAEAPKSKSKGGLTFGKGIYDSLNRDLEAMIAESMNVSVNMSMDEHGEPRKNITVSAEGEAAEQLAQLLNLAGIAGKVSDQGDHSDCGCGTSPCSCDEMVDENAPDYPTNTAVIGDDDPHLMRYAGGLNKPKETGQTTVPVVNRDPRRGSYGPAEMSESKDLGMQLYAELKSFKG